jgi:hypothetical protein
MTSETHSTSSGQAKNCQNCRQDFTIEPDDFGFYEKIGVPAPALCPDCRYQRRLMDRNEWSLYRRKCDATGKSIISIYRPEVPFPVYEQGFWRSDGWDQMKYGRDFDFNRPFFEQFGELRTAVPHTSLVSPDSVNSEYSNQCQNNKDCYMVSASGSNEKCMYGNWFQGGNYMSSDCYMIEKGELCYECMNCGRCYACTWSDDCFDCTAVHFSLNCRGCTNCFGCANLRNKNYQFFNEQLSKEEYEKRLAEFDWSRGSIREMKIKMRGTALRVPHKNFHGSKTQDSSGDYIENTQRARLNFNCRESKETAYLQDSWDMIDCWDNTEVLTAERCYELQGCAFLRNCLVLRSCTTMTDCSYCDMCFSLTNCFGCFGLKSKEYCILNKQYSKEEYLSLKSRIIAHMKKTGEWGSYFPPEQSPFGYNESVAQDFFPLTESEAKQKGLPWYNSGEKDYKPTLNAADLPSTFSETKDSILNEVIRCRTQDSEEEERTHPLCATAFRMIPMEFDLYRKLNIPVPDKCFPCRRTDRFARRNPRKLWPGKCQCAGVKSENGIYQNIANHFHKDGRCPNEFETSYSPERKEIIYCEQCYQAEVV